MVSPFLGDTGLMLDITVLLKRVKNDNNKHLDRIVGTLMTNYITWIVQEIRNGETISPEDGLTPAEIQELRNLPEDLQMMIWEASIDRLQEFLKILTDEIRGPQGLKDCWEGYDQLNRNIKEN